jgi:tetratricopeptide (TPR) repeat protein
MLFERAGDQAAARGDADSAVQHYQRGHELARRVLLDTGDTNLDEGLATFSRKLGAALRASGDRNGAEGVLREALAAAAPRSAQRVRMLTLLGELAAERAKATDALRWYGLALQSAQALADPSSEADVQRALGRMKDGVGDTGGAIAALQRCQQCLLQAKAGPGRQAVVALELASALHRHGDFAGAAACLDQAEQLADGPPLQHLRARAYGQRGQLARGQGDPRLASTCFAQATSLAEQAGDAVQARTWGHAARIALAA